LTRPSLPTKGHGKFRQAGYLEFLMMESYFTQSSAHSSHALIIKDLRLQTLA
jgi:hypothetical protein